MFGFKKNKPVESSSRAETRPAYRQVAVTPKAHARLKEIADRTNASIVSTVDNILGV